MLSWRLANALLYRAYSVWQQRPRRLRLALPERAPRAGGKQRLGFLSWGLIGDAVLTTATLRHFRRAFPEHEIVALAREQTRCVLEPHVDRFVPLDPNAGDLGAPFTEAVRRGELDRCDVLTGDVHVFYGGLARLFDLIERWPARDKVFYEGYARRDQLAAWRRFPRGVHVVSSLPKPTGPGPRDEWHVLHDQLHLFRCLYERVHGRPLPSELREDVATVVSSPEPEALRARLALPERYVACHVVSNNPKKDWPLESWKQLMHGSPHEFVVLGTARDRDRVRMLEARNVRILCGETTLAESIALIGAATAFVGLDSGLAHVAASLGQSSVVIAQNATLGYFFPYPRLFARGRLITLWNHASPACVGCFFSCPREPLYELVTRGARCLRELPPERVAAALEQALSR